jgi:hypothetical protein
MRASTGLLLTYTSPRHSGTGAENVPTSFAVLRLEPSGATVPLPILGWCSP